MADKAERTVELRKRLEEVFEEFRDVMADDLTMPSLADWVIVVSHDDVGSITDGAAYTLSGYGQWSHRSSGLLMRAAEPLPGADDRRRRRLMPDASHEFKPDWMMHPGVMLREWLDAERVPPHLFASVAGIDHGFFDRLLACDPSATIDEKMATHIHHGTQLCGIGPSVQFWLNSERFYREGLERGATDTSAVYVEERPLMAGVDFDELEKAAQALYEGPGHMEGDLPWDVLTDQSRQGWRDEVCRRLSAREFTIVDEDT